MKKLKLKVEFTRYVTCSFEAIFDVSNGYDDQNEEDFEESPEDFIEQASEHIKNKTIENYREDVFIKDEDADFERVFYFSYEED